MEVLEPSYPRTRIRLALTDEIFHDAAMKWFRDPWFVSPPILAGVTLVLAAFLIGVRIDLPLLEPEEARYAEIPRQMMDQGRFLVPVHDGLDYLDKPPLLYWLVMASLQSFGVHNAAARLPAALAAWLTVVVVLAWGWRTAGPMVGVAGALVLTLCGDFLYRAPMLTMNGLLALFVTLALATAHVALQERSRWRWWLFSGAACGLAVMTKGAVGIALVAPPVVLWPWIDRRLPRPTWTSYLAWGVGLGFVAGPWFVAVARERPEFIEYFFWKHHVERFTQPFDHAGPFWLYLPQLTLGFLPWSFIVAYLLMRRRPGNASTALDLAQFAALAGVWGFAFFSAAGSKRPVYLVAVEPPLALAIGAFCWHMRENLPRWLWLGVTLTTASAMIAMTAVWLPRYSDQFSAEAVVLKVRRESAGVPIFCFGHGWDSIGFLLQRNDVRTFLGPERDAITQALAKQPRSLVFVTTRRDGGDFENLMPPGMVFVPLAQNRQLRAGIVAGPDAK